MDGEDGKAEDFGIVTTCSENNRESRLRLEATRTDGREHENEWTDEKHRLYLSSIEASFVKQLHNHHHHLKNLHTWSSRREKVLYPYSSQSNINGNFSFDQLKVLQRDNWKDFTFKRSQRRQRVANGSVIPSENEFSQHSRPDSMTSDLEVPRRETIWHDKSTSEVVQLEGLKYRKEVCGLAESSRRKLIPPYFAMCLQDSVGSNSEVSDQNFEEEVSAVNRLNNPRKERKKEAVDDTSKDQVVPLVISPGMVNASERKEDENCGGWPLEITAIREQNLHHLEAGR